MKSRIYARKKSTREQTPDFSTAPAQPMFQSRSFVVQTQNEEKSQPPDLKTSLRQAQRYGHRLSRMQHTGGEAATTVQPKLGMGQPILSNRAKAPQVQQAKLTVGDGGAVQLAKPEEKQQRRPKEREMTQPLLRGTGTTIQRVMGKVKIPVNINLQQDEADGGHTIDRHVGKTADFIKNRVIDQQLDAASTFENIETAQQVVQDAIEANHTEINNILFAAQAGPPNRVFQYEAGRSVGQYLAEQNVIDKKRREKKQKQLKKDATRVTLVLRIQWQPQPPHQFYVLTCYPNPPAQR